MPEHFKVRFDGSEAWAKLTPEQQADIGAIALELVITWNGQDAYRDDPDRSRPFEAADTLLHDLLFNAAEDAIRDAVYAEPLGIPSRLGQVCRECGCSQEDACDEGCGWAEEDLCTACAARASRREGAA